MCEHQKTNLTIRFYEGQQNKIKTLGKEKRNVYIIKKKTAKCEINNFLLKFQNNEVGAHLFFFYFMGTSPKLINKYGCYLHDDYLLADSLSYLFFSKIYILEVLIFMILFIKIRSFIISIL